MYEHGADETNPSKVCYAFTVDSFRVCIMWRAIKRKKLEGLECLLLLIVRVNPLDKEQEYPIENRR